MIFVTYRSIDIKFYYTFIPSKYSLIQPISFSKCQLNNDASILNVPFTVKGLKELLFNFVMILMSLCCNETN